MAVGAGGGAASAASATGRGRLREADEVRDMAAPCKTLWAHGPRYTRSRPLRQVRLLHRIGRERGFPHPATHSQ